MRWSVLTGDRPDSNCLSARPSGMVRGEVACEVVSWPLDRTPQLLLVTGLGLFLLGLFHVAVWGFAGGAWEGPVSWRKPILFGTSIGVTVISLGWVYTKLNRRPGDFLFALLFCLSMTIEVLLITVQQWRGVASHFNRETAFDQWIDLSMTVAITIAFLFILAVFRRSFGPLRAAPDMKLAIRAGLSFLVISCLVGFGLLFYGHDQITQGGNPSVMGKAGVPKFPHGVAIHAIQWLPLFSWLGLRWGIAEKKRTRMIVCVVVATALFLLFSINQTYQGRARWDMAFSGWILFSLAIAPLLSIPFIMATKKSGGWFCR